MKGPKVHSLCTEGFADAQMPLHRPALYQHYSTNNIFEFNKFVSWLCHNAKKPGTFRLIFVGKKKKKEEAGIYFPN